MALQTPDEVSEVDRLIINHFEQLADQQNIKYWHCRVKKCDKTFKGENYMWKHFKDRHSDELVKQRKKYSEATMRERYKADKNRITLPPSLKDKLEVKERPPKDYQKPHRHDGPSRVEASKPSTSKTEEKSASGFPKSKGLFNYDTIAF